MVAQVGTQRVRLSGNLLSWWRLRCQGYEGVGIGHVRPSRRGRR